MYHVPGTVIWISWNILSVAFSSSVSLTDYGELNLFEAPISYSVDTTVLLNDLSRKDKEVGYKVAARLDVAPAWRGGPADVLLKFDLVSPQLLSRGTHISADFLPYKSLWDSHSHSTFYAYWKNGLVESSYLDASDPLDIINYKKSLISLFQFQVIDGQHNETDISGICRVAYETLSMQVIRKIKRECWSEEGGAGVAGGAGVQSRRLARYSLSGALDALDELYAEEVHVAGDAPSGLALKVRAWQRLARRAPPPPAPPAPPPALAAALAALPAALAPHALRLLPALDDLDEDLELSAALAEAEAALRAEDAGAGGDAGAARAALLVPPALRAAPRAALARLLDEPRAPAHLEALCALLGLAGGAATHGAAAAFLQLHGREPLEAPARRYLAALALAERPDEAVVLDVLRAGGAPGPLAAPALLAAAAAAPRASPRAQRAVRAALLDGLAACKEAECEVTRLEALGNLRRADCAEPLLAAAERARAAGPALSALAGLRALGAVALAAAGALRRLEALALAPRRAALAALEVRAAALLLLLELSAPAPAHLQRTIHALQQDEPELRRVLWAALDELGERHAAVRSLLRLLPPRLAAWPARAASGTSSVLCRAAGAWRGRAARLCSTQLARRALLRRGRVALQFVDAANDTTDAFAVEVWTKGLEAVTGDAEGAGGTGEAEEEASAGLALEVGGVRLPGLTLFRGQGELLGHVWAGRGSEPTAVLRALRPLAPRGGRVPLLAGGVLRWRLRAALAYALDAQAQVSLWSRSARSQLELRGALAARCEARVAAGGAALAGRAELASEPRLRLAADLDFYDGVALCVRASLPAHERALNATLQAAAGPLRVRRARLARHPAPARTLSLGARNDRACRTLTSADD